MTLGDEKLNFKKLLSVFLCITLLISIFSNALFVIAEEINNKDIVMIGTITEPGENKVGVIIRPDAKREGKVITIADKTIVTVTGSKNDLNNEKNAATNKAYVWYAVTYTNSSKTYSGYIREDMITVKQYKIDNTFKEKLKDFPESYHESLIVLHAQYPNWIFEANNIVLTYDEAVKLESEYPKKLIMNSYLSWASMDKNWYNWSTGTYVKADDNLYGASREVISYYMDPRNFLNSNDIYTFMKQSYDNRVQTLEGVRALIKGRFLEKTYTDPKDTAYGGDYALVIMEAAKQTSVDPYALVATIIQEQGTNGTNFTNGSMTYNGVTVYNFFNFGASGDSAAEIQKNAAEYAYNAGWTTRSAAIIGGAKKYSSGYVNSSPSNPYYNQDTEFYKHFNLLNPKKIGDQYTISHQYAQNIQAHASESNIFKNQYSNNHSATLIFRIPVYKNNSLPKTPVSLPPKNNNTNNYYLNVIEVDGLTPSFSRYTYSYALEIKGDKTIYVNAPKTASITSKMTFNLIKGKNNVVITVKSETGYTNDYTINVNALADCVLTITTEKPPTTKPKILNGDTDCNGNIDLSDLTNISLYLANRVELSEDGKVGADTDNDDDIDLADLTNISLHLAGYINLNSEV